MQKKYKNSYNQDNYNENTNFTQISNNRQSYITNRAEHSKIQATEAKIFSMASAHTKNLD